VLYVDDMVENLRLVEQILSHRPSVTKLAAMLGGVALDLAAQHRPDVILLDLNLPDMPPGRRWPGAPCRRRPGRPSEPEPVSPAQ